MWTTRGKTRLHPSSRFYMATATTRFVSYATYPPEAQPRTPRTPHPHLRPVPRAKVGGGRPRTHLTLVSGPVLRGGSLPAGPRMHLSPNQPHRCMRLSTHIPYCIGGSCAGSGPCRTPLYREDGRGVPASPRCYYGALCVVGDPFFFSVTSPIHASISMLQLFVSRETVLYVRTVG